MGARVAARAVWTAPALGASALLVAVLWMCNRGLEMIDEGYLLRLVADPQATRTGGDVYLFGFLLHPLYEAVGRDVALFRAVGFVAAAAGAAALAHEGIALVRARGVVVPRERQLAVVLVTAASTASLLSFNVMVPAYRTVAFLGSVCAAVGVARIGRGSSAVGGALVGTGVWLCFVGKPTSAVALLVAVVVLALATGLLSRRSLTAAAVGGLAAAGLTLLVAGMSPAEAATYLARGAQGAQALGSHPGLAVLLGLGDPSVQVLVFAPFFLLPLAAAWILRRGRAPRRQHAVDLAAMVLMVLAGLGVAALGAALTGAVSTGWQVLSLGLAVPVVALVVLFREPALRSAARPRVEVGWLGLLLVLPYVNAVGTNLPIGPAMGLTSAFWVVALLVVALGRGGPADDAGDAGDAGLLPGALVLSLTVAATMTWVVHCSGPDGGDLSGGLRPAPVEGGQLLLHPRDAAAAVQLRRAAVDHGLDERTPVVDVSGMGAGYALMTGGRPLGRAHLYAYLPRSGAAARLALARESCADRAAAWVLFAPGNPADLSPALTGEALDLQRDYDPVVAFEFFRDGRTWTMQLLRPRASVHAELGC